MMSPPSPCSMSAFAAAFDTRNEPFAMTSCCRSQSFSVVSSSGFDSDSPALLTTRSMPPNASSVASIAACTPSASATFAATPIATSVPPELGRGGLRLLEVEVGDDDARALGGEAGRDGLADAGCRARDERDAALVGLGLRHPLQLRLFERPVLDAELLGIRDRRVGRERLGAAHHVDRVEVELAGDAGGLLVRAVAEHADTRARAR